MTSTAARTTSRRLIPLADQAGIELIAYRRVTADEHDHRYVIGGRARLAVLSPLITAILDADSGDYSDERPLTGEDTIAAAMERHVNAVRGL